LLNAPLGQILETALTGPADLTPSALAAVVEALDPRDAAGWGPALSAILYARPDLAGPPLVDRLGALLEDDGVTEPVVDAVVIVLVSFAGSDLAAPALEALLRLLQSEAVSPPIRARLVPVLRAYASWCPELLDVQTVLRLAASPLLSAHREALLGRVLEPLLAHAPARATETVLQAIQAAFDGCARLRYTLHMIGERQEIAPSVRQRAEALTGPAFPARAAARAVFGRDPFHLLVVLNVRVGQGDEIVRLAALLQALLDANAGLHVTLVTRRTYLYDHPRVRPVSIVDPAAVGGALEVQYDGVLHVEEPGWPEVSWDPPLDARVRELVVSRRPRLLITAEVGHNHCVYSRVELDGRDIAAERALDRLDVDTIYDGCARLLAELGLRGRVAEERPTGPSLLIGDRSLDAERAWARLTDGLAPPIALVNPYGGALSMKGYPSDRPERLADELAGLVAEGYSVVLLPNGTAWASPEAVSSVLARLAPRARRRVAVAPDPTEPDPDRRVETTEHPELSYADQAMRLFKYFAGAADLVVAVEGWMAHLAYALGRPFRLVLQAQSHSLDWHPAPRGPHQRLSGTLSPCAGPAPAETLGEKDPPPQPPLHRKPLFVTAVAGLPALGDRAVPLLVRALGSGDHDVRAVAVAALGRLLPAGTPRDHVLAALRDRESLVRLAAAEALLAAGADCTRELGPRFREQLLAHRAIARQDWKTVRHLGVTALPALFVAADGGIGPISREARWATARVLAALGVDSLERRERGKGPVPAASG
jgi:hypothetical protein